MDCQDKDQENWWTIGHLCWRSTGVKWSNVVAISKEGAEDTVTFSDGQEAVNSQILF